MLEDTNSLDGAHFIYLFIFLIDKKFDVKLCESWQIETIREILAANSLDMLCLHLARMSVI